MYLDVSEVPWKNAYFLVHYAFGAWHFLLHDEKHNRRWVLELGGPLSRAPSSVLQGVRRD